MAEKKQRLTVVVRRGFNWIAAEAGATYEEISGDNSHGMNAAARREIEAALTWLRENSEKGDSRFK